MTKGSFGAIVDFVPVAMTVILGCQREDRDFRPIPPSSENVRYSEDYEWNAYSQSEGRQLFKAMNCNGCHADGGGAIGPALMDEQWIYGFEPKKIFETIAYGRPNGMPAFGGKASAPEIHVVGYLPESQIWQLVAYVRSLSGLAPSSAVTGRDDHLWRRPPEHTINPPKPVVEPPVDAGDKPK
jgi:cytochrome c oxidase cbb3-type subunit 3